MRRPSVAPWVLAALLSAAAPALTDQAYPACPREPTAKEEEAARGAFAAGRAAYAEGDYARAIDYWKDAYRRACKKHDMLKNLALAYELSGNPEEAVVAISTYLERVPDAADRDEMSRKIESLETRIESEKREAEERTPPTPAQPEPAPTSPPPPAPVEVDPGAVTRAKEPINVPPLLLAGAGVLIAGVGTAGYLIQNGAVKDFEESECPNFRCTSATVDDANASFHTRNALGAVALGGAAVAVTGGVWYLIQPRKARSGAARLEPRLAPGFTGLSFRTVF